VAPRSIIQDHEDIEKLSELGVLFLLFEMGLELSIDRLKSLAKFAFGMGSLQVGTAEQGPGPALGGCPRLGGLRWHAS
jgi:Kef-type K+ transport system membrane component KefB